MDICALQDLTIQDGDNRIVLPVHRDITVQKAPSHILIFPAQLDIIVQVEQLIPKHFHVPQVHIVPLEI